MASNVILFIAAGEDFCKYISNITYMNGYKGCDILDRNELLEFLNEVKCTYITNYSDLRMLREISKYIFTCAMI